MTAGDAAAKDQREFVGLTDGAIGVEEPLLEGIDGKYAEEAEQAVATSTGDDFLKRATLAEIRLIHEDYSEAARLYKEAMLMDPEALGLHKEFLSEARALMDLLKTPEKERIQIEHILEG